MKKVVSSLAVILVLSSIAGATTTTVYLTTNDKYQRVVAQWDGWDQSLRIGNPENGYDSSPQRMLMQFDLSSIPSNAQITSAVLYLDNYNPAGTTPIPTAIERITEPWNLGVRWTTQPAYDATPAATGTWSFSWSHYEGSWDITSLVQDWIDNTYPNYGIIVRHNSEEEGDGDNVYGPPWCGWWNVYRPTDPPESGYGPKIEVEYSVVPEPATIGILLLGLVFLRRQK